MANLAWYNDNQFRDYPFVTRTKPLELTPPQTGEVIGEAVLPSESSTSSQSVGPIVDLPHSAIVDFGAIMEIDSGYDEAAGHYAYLHSIERSGTTLNFRFRNTSPESYNHELLFVRDINDTEFAIEWTEAITFIGDPVDPLVCPLAPKWSGFLVTGDLSELAALIPDGITVIYANGLWQIEPARLQSLTDSYLRAINIGNTPRLVTDAAPGCESSSISSQAAPDILIRDTCVTGPIWFQEGYNCRIRQDSGRNTITIGAGVGLGAGEPCDEVPLTDDETPIGNSPFLTGGPGCKQIVQSLNGVNGSDITLTAGAGYRIQPDATNPNKLVVERALGDFALCAEPDPETSSSSLSSGVIILP